MNSQKLPPHPPHRQCDCDDCKPSFEPTPSDRGEVDHNEMVPNTGVVYGAIVQGPKFPAPFLPEAATLGQATSFAKLLGFHPLSEDEGTLRKLREDLPSVEELRALEAQDRLVVTSRDPGAFPSVTEYTVTDLSTTEKKSMVFMKPGLYIQYPDSGTTENDRFIPMKDCPPDDAPAVDQKRTLAELGASMEEHADKILGVKETLQKLREQVVPFVDAIKERKRMPEDVTGVRVTQDEIDNGTLHVDIWLRPSPALMARMTPSPDPGLMLIDGVCPVRIVSEEEFQKAQGIKLEPPYDKPLEDTRSPKDKFIDDWIEELKSSNKDPQ